MLGSGFNDCGFWLSKFFGRLGETIQKFWEEFKAF